MGWGLSSLVYVHSSIYNDLWSTGGEGGVCLHWCSGLPQMYGQLEEGVGSVCTGICAYFYM